MQKALFNLLQRQKTLFQPKMFRGKGWDVSREYRRIRTRILGRLGFDHSFEYESDRSGDIELHDSSPGRLLSAKLLEKSLRFMKFCSCEELTLGEWISWKS